MAGLPSFRGQASFATWLYRIAYQCSVRQLERRKRERSRHSVMHAEQILEGMNKEQQVGTIKTHLFRARNLLKERLLAQHLCGQELRELL